MTQSKSEYAWGKLVIFGFAVLLPAVIVAISTWHVLRPSFWIIAPMLLVTAGIAAVFTYYSGDATPKVARYCIIAHVVLCFVLCCNLILHVLVARDVAMAIEGVAEVHTEQDRAEKMRQNESVRQERLLTQQAELARAESERLKREAIRNDSAYRLGGRNPNAVRQSTPLVAQVAPDIASLPVAPAVVIGPTENPDAIRRGWAPWLVGSAILDVLVSVLAAAILVGQWEWDRNHDGIDDRQQVAGMRYTPGFAAQPSARKERGEDDPK